MTGSAMRIGVLALQGGFAEHINVLRACGSEPVEIRRKTDFTEDLAGLVIPGGESTVMAKLLAEFGLMGPLAGAIRNGMPVFGTCAGLILMAKDVEAFPATPLGQLDISVKRNAYGSQKDSFSVYGHFADMADIPMVFIRAPGITHIGQKSIPLAEVDGQVVAVRQDNMLATTFHPELTNVQRVHKYFLAMISNQRQKTKQKKYAIFR